MLLGCALFGPMPAEPGIELCRAVREELPDRHRLTAAASLRAEAGLHAMCGRTAEARELLAQDRAIGLELGLHVLTMYVAQVATLVELLAGDPVAAEREVRLGVETAQAIGDTMSLSELAALHARTLAASGRDDEALEQTRVSESVASAGDVITEAPWRAVRSEVLARQGELDEAEALAREAVRMADETDLLPLRGDVHASLAAVLELAGRSDEAAEERARARAVYEAKGAVAAVERLAADGVTVLDGRGT
jgi:ATP/maltotriose-dependent transcriptional regulator MalT